MRQPHRASERAVRGDERERRRAQTRAEANNRQVQFSNLRVRRQGGETRRGRRGRRRATGARGERSAQGPTGRGGDAVRQRQADVRVRRLRRAHVIRGQRRAKDRTRNR